MTWLRVSACFLALSVLVAPILATVCPDGCVCNTTRDGLHRATCSSLPQLYKFTLRQKHHNINILDLSHNNITKLNHELDRLTEVVTLDLSTNGIQTLNKFFHNAKKLVHLNLANNRIQTLSFVHLPSSVSSLDLTNNLLKDVPSDIEHLVGLEHLEMEGNPLDCSCENLLARDRLLIANVYIDNVKCASPTKNQGKSWLELKLKDICKVPKPEPNFMDMMLGDQPVDAVQIGKETSALKSLPLVSKNDLEDGNVIQGNVPVEDDDQQFMKVGSNSSPSPYSQIEGSGDGGDDEYTTMWTPYMETKIQRKDDKGLSTINEGSGETEGSGDDDLYTTIVPIIIDDTTTTPYEELIIPKHVHRLLTEDDKSSTEFPLPEPMSPLYTGGSNWREEPSPEVTSEATSPTPRDTTRSEQIRVTQPYEVQGQSENPAPHKTGTYVCIAVIVILLVGLIGFAIIKGQMRKRRDRRLMRQQKRDVEKASKEMVDMNKSLLGKPAGVEAPVDKKVNGKYELVPTHETPQKKTENGELGNGLNKSNNNGLRTESPRDTNQNKSSSRDNNLVDDRPQQHETSFDSEPTSPDSRKDTNSLSSEDIFVPINDEDNSKLNGTGDSDISQPLINGDQNTDSDFLSPSREYVPVYSPDMGRVRIKMTETPKPKTPVLVTRSRSNAGDIIITPSDALKPTT
ncbi:hypothetical protein PYW08_007178 [Mythimna loreyi]|uniref:Uncharacterized protein n=1 Tax=Mythimna loreyi TaxID=667449 RepID=A0ACC2R9K0_9NEOP|nr:hypothetical protein PYW08_007178 [Mythimna loreyi]